MTRSPLAITFVLPCYPRRPVGGFRVIYEYANRLVARGHRVRILHARRSESVASRSTGLSVRGLKRTAREWRDRFSKPPVRWMSVDHRVDLLYAPSDAAANVPDGDVVFATAWQTAEAVASYGIRKGKGYYLLQHVEYLLGESDETSVLKPRVEATWKFPLRRVAVSRWIADHVERAVGDRDTVVIPPGIDVSRFRAYRKLEERPLQVAMMYAPARAKGADDGLAAIRAARRRHPELKAVLFGAGRAPRSLSTWMTYEMNLAEGPLVTLYNNARYFLCSSLAEGFALPPAEAMACGCAVVSTDCGGNREYAEDGVSALLSPPGSPEALARNLCLLIEDDELCGRVAAAGRRSVAALDWERSTDRLELLLRTS